jgi:hypothetical protein
LNDGFNSGLLPVTLICSMPESRSIVVTSSL